MQLSPAQAFVIPHIGDRVVGELADEPLVKQLPIIRRHRSTRAWSVVWGATTAIWPSSKKRRAVETAGSWSVS